MKDTLKIWSLGFLALVGGSLFLAAVVGFVKLVNWLLETVPAWAIYSVAGLAAFIVIPYLVGIIVDVMHEGPYDAG